MRLSMRTLPSGPGVAEPDTDGGVLPAAWVCRRAYREAIFLDFYLYAWERLPPRKHMLTGIPIVIAGVASLLLWWLYASFQREHSEE